MIIKVCNDIAYDNCYEFQSYLVDSYPNAASDWNDYCAQINAGNPFLYRFNGTVTPPPLDPQRTHHVVAAIGYKKTGDTPSQRWRIVNYNSAAVDKPCYLCEAEMNCSTGIYAVIPGGGPEKMHYSGSLTQDATWSAGVFIDADVIVESGVTLTILPGTSVKFADNARLTVKGKLIAEGTPSDCIILRSTQVTRSHGLWEGIVFNSSADNTSSIQYATIKNADYGIYLRSGRKPTISHNTITYNIYGIYANDPGSVNITYNSIEKNSYGISIDFANGGTLSHNTVVDNDTTGIYLYQGSLTFLRDNLINRNGTKSNHAGIYMQSCTAQMGFNTIKWNKNGVYLVSSSPNMYDNIVGGSAYWGLRIVNSNPILAYYGNAHNDINYNGTITTVGGEIYITDDSNPLLDGGHNDIVTCSGGPPYRWHIWINTETDWDTVYARNNWWGSTDPSNFHFHPAGGVVYDPYSESANTDRTAKPLVFRDADSLQASYDELFHAMDLEYQGYYQEAAEAYRQIIAKYGSHIVSRRALSGLVTVTHLSGGDLRGLHRELENIAQSFQGTGFGRKAQILALDCLELAGDYEGAIAGYQKLRLEKGEAGAFAVLRIGQIALYGIGDKSRAERLFRELVSASPSSEAAELARMHLAELPDLPESLGRDVPPPRPEPEISEGSGVESNVFSLSQSYPNPGNPSTTITFTLPQKAHVTLEIYNLLGQRVRTLVEGVKEAGPHAVVWDGRDELGKIVPTGIYLYRLQSADFVRVRKMVLVR